MFYGFLIGKMKLALVCLNKQEGGEYIPPLGLVSIATYLKEYLGFENTRILDINFEDIYKSFVEYEPDIIGIASMAIEYGKAIKFAEKIKEHNRNIPIIIGGVHISTLPSSLKECFDIAVIGEGEETMLELIQLFEKKGKFSKIDLKKIDGIAFYDKNKLIITNRRELIEPLDKIPIPDKRLLNKKYFERRKNFGTGKYSVVAYMLTSRGCPYRCVFCSTSIFWKKVRFNSVGRVVSEIKELVEDYKVDHISIWDDIFTINRPRLKEIASRLMKEHILDKVSFGCQPRANLVDDELCKILKSMNMETVDFGFESGSERMLRYLKNGSVTVEDNKGAIKLCKKYGFRIYGSLIFGSPSETIEDMKETLDFIKFTIKNGADYIWSFVMTPFPGTQIWEIAKKRDKVSDNMNWDMISHQNIGNPLLLDQNINLKDFKKIFFKARSKLNYFKWKLLMRSLLNNPIETLKKGFFNPVKSFKILFKKTVE